MNQINEKDSQLFRASVDSVVPVDKDAADCSKLEKQPPFVAYSYIIDGVIAGEEVINYAKNGASPKLINKMKRGSINQAPVLDLHGENIRGACEKLSDFIYRHQFEQFVQIIHGKGYQSENGISILKTQVVNFLKQHPQILACHSCPQKDGGTGAVFALLKKQSAKL